MTLLEAAPWGAATAPWSGIGAEGWDGTVCPDDLRLLSASSVPKALASPALETWSIERTVEKLAERLPEFHARYSADPAAAIKWAGQLRYEPDGGAELNAADSGTLMHSLLEAWLKGEAIPDHVTATVMRDPVLVQMAEHLWGWFNRFRPEPVLLEQVVYDPANGLAGRLDAVVRFAAAPEMGTVLMDLKNSRTARYRSGGLKRPYGDSHALQLATYRYAPLLATFTPRMLVTQRRSASRTYLINTAERQACAAVPQIDSTVIVFNTPEGCKAYPIDTGPGVHRRAIEAVGLHRWLHEESSNAVGQPVTPAFDVPNV